MTETRIIPKPRRAACAMATCRHEACWHNRDEVQQPCSRCGEPIGFGVPFLSESTGKEFEPDRYTHAACVLPANSIFTHA